MFSAPDAPAPIAMQRIAVNAAIELMSPGATTMPASPVKITSDITRGFRSAKKSPTVATREPSENVSTVDICPQVIRGSSL